MEGDKWQLVLHADDARGYVEAFQRAVREQTSFSAEVRVRRADGEWRWVASCADPRSSPDGEFLGHVGLSPDITERRQNEKALRFQHSLIRAAVEAERTGDAPAWLIDTDRQATLTRWHERRKADTPQRGEVRVEKLKTGLAALADRALHIAL